MTCVARRGLGKLRSDGRWCQPGTGRRPRHDWSMRLLAGRIAPDLWLGDQVTVPRATCPRRMVAGLVGQNERFLRCQLP